MTEPTALPGTGQPSERPSGPGAPPLRPIRTPSQGAGGLLQGEPVPEREWVDDEHGAPQRGLPPTPRQLEVFLLAIQLGGHQQAATAAGISLQTEKKLMSALYARLGVYNQLSALWLVYPLLLALTLGERRSGQDRRRSRDRRRPGIGRQPNPIRTGFA